MKIAAWLLEPLHWIKVFLAVGLWILIAPTLWEVLRAVAALPGGGGLLFTFGGLPVIQAMAMRRHRSRHVLVGCPHEVHDVRSAQQVWHAARHEAAHAVVAWSAGAQVISIDVIPVLDRGGRCSARLPGESLVQDAWVSLQLSLAAIVEDECNQVRAQGGGSADVSQAITQVAVIISTGQRPDGYEGALTFDGLIGGATARARQILEEHEDLIEAITAQLLTDPTKPLIDPDLDGMRRELTGKRELVSS